MSCCMCELEETAQSLRADTHEVAAREHQCWDKCPSEHVFFFVDGWNAWHIGRCSNTDVGRSERETTTPREQESHAQALSLCV